MKCGLLEMGHIQTIAWLSNQLSNGDAALYIAGDCIGNAGLILKCHAYCAEARRYLPLKDYTMV